MVGLFSSPGAALLAQKVESLEKAMLVSAEAVKERIVLSDQLREEKIDTVYEFVKQLYDEVKGLRTDVKALSRTHNHIVGAVGLGTIIITTAVGALGLLTNKP